MNSKIKLPDKFTNVLINLPEQGMGYQVVTVVLKNGIRLMNRRVLNATYLLLQENENIDPAEIDRIE